MIERVVSGGQTGVDRAALDVALRLGVPCGGWCPAGRLAEDGRLSAVYPLMEAPGGDYAERTRLNVRDSDGTLILSVGAPSGGTAYTLACARQLGRPVLVVELGGPGSIAPVGAWLKEHDVRCLNVAGPRASTAPGVYELAVAYLEAVFLAHVRIAPRIE